MWDAHAKNTVVEAVSAHPQNANTADRESSLTVHSVEDSRDNMVHTSLEMSDSSLEHIFDANDVNPEELERFAQMDDTEIRAEKDVINAETRKKER